MEFAKLLEDHEFKASNGWLDSFKKRHNLKFASVSGKVLDVDLGLVEDWKARLPTICQGYEESNIFNTDKTGLLFR